MKITWQAQGTRDRFEDGNQNMIHVQLAHKKSHFEHRSGNNSILGENDACALVSAQPSVSHKEEEIQNSSFNMSQVSVQV